MEQSEKELVLAQLVESEGGKVLLELLQHEYCRRVHECVWEGGEKGMLSRGSAQQLEWIFKRLSPKHLRAVAENIAKQGGYPQQ